MNEDQSLHSIPGAGCPAPADLNQTLVVRFSNRDVQCWLDQLSSNVVQNKET